jgi:hypothetical protein
MIHRKRTEASSFKSENQIHRQQRSSAKTQSDAQQTTQQNQSRSTAEMPPCRSRNQPRALDCRQRTNCLRKQPCARQTAAANRANSDTPRSKCGEERALYKKP